MLAAQLAVDALVELAIRRIAAVERAVAAGLGRQLLLDDIRAQRDAQVIGLPGQVGAGFMVHAVYGEGGVAHIAPQNGRHAQLVRQCEGFCHLDHLAIAVGAAEINRRPHGHRAHIPGLLDRAEHDLLVRVGVGHQFVVVDLDDIRDAMGEAPSCQTERAKCRCHRVAAALQRQLDDLLGVEVSRVGREGRPGRMLNALVDRQYGHIARARQAPAVGDLLQAADDAWAAVAVQPDAFAEVAAGQSQAVARDGRALVCKQVIGGIAQRCGDLVQGGFRHGVFLADVLFASDYSRNAPRLCYGMAMLNRPHRPA